MIRLEELTRTFDGTVAIRDLTLSVSEGQVFGFIGPNGAGKTTTVRILCCLIGASSGRAFIGENECGKEPDSMYIRQMIGLLPEAPGLYDRLSAYRNLDFYGRLYGVKDGQRKERIKDLLTTLKIWHRKDECVSTFSKGMRQKIAIARALVHEPRILFLDEPTAGLDPEAAKTVREFILDLKREGGTIFLNTHNLYEAERLCDRIGVLKTRLVAVGSPDELSRRFWGRTTVVRVKSLTPQILDAVRSLDFVTNLQEEDGELFIGLDNPDERNPTIARTIMENGGEIQYISEFKRRLEEVYLKLIGGSA
ncbi:MAG: ABC transporter ATP-binding protein [Thermoplasmata archaeon]